MPSQMWSMQTVPLNRGFASQSAGRTVMGNTTGSNYNATYGLKSQWNRGKW